MTMPTDGIKISLLPTLASPTASDLLPIVSGGTTDKTTPAALSTDYKSLSVLPNSVTYLGQRSYQLVYPSTDYSTILSAGMRLLTTRLTAAPTNATLLNGTNQYWVKTTPSKLTFTDDFVVSAWVKVSSYAQSAIISRYNGTSGWTLYMLSTGQVRLEGTNAAAANFSYVQSYQSLPLNRWVHVTAQLDMSAFTPTTTTSYTMIDGVDVPASVSRGGTNPTALVQAGNLEVGSTNGGTNLYPGKIAQVAIFNAKVTQATLRGYISQGLLGTETSLDSAYSFNSSANDLNTTTPNNLTAMNSAGYTADSPFGGQASGLISSTLDYAIIQTVTYVTDTTLVVQVPEGCTIPTSSSGVSANSYATVKSPYGFPDQTAKWEVGSYSFSRFSNASVATGTYINAGSWNITIPAGSWKLMYEAACYTNRGAAGVIDIKAFLGTTAASATGAIVLSYAASYAYANVDTAPWIHKEITYSVSTQTVLYMNQLNNAGVTVTTLGWLNDFATGQIVATNAYL